MKNKSVGVIILLLAISLLVNILAYFSVTSTTEKVTKIRNDYQISSKKQEEKIAEQSAFIENNTTTALEKIAEDKQKVTDVLFILFDYSPKTKEARYQKVEPLVSSEVYEILAPEIQPVEELKNETETETDDSVDTDTEEHPHAHYVSDEKETVTIKDIKFYSESKGDYLVRYKLNYDFPERESISYEALTHIKLTNGVITHWQQNTIDFSE